MASAYLDAMGTGHAEVPKMIHAKLIPAAAVPEVGAHPVHTRALRAVHPERATALQADQAASRRSNFTRRIPCEP